MVPNAPLLHDGVRYAAAGQEYGAAPPNVQKSKSSSSNATLSAFVPFVLHAAAAATATVVLGILLVVGTIAYHHSSSTQFGDGVSGGGGVGYSYNRWVVITSIQAPTKYVKKMCTFAAGSPDVNVVVVADRKTPTN